MDEDGDASCGFCARDGGGGGGRLRRELWSGGDGLIGTEDSVGSSNGVGEGRRPGDCLGLSKALLLPAREEPLGTGGDSLAFCSKRLLRSFTANVSLASTSCERVAISDIEKEKERGGEPRTTDVKLSSTEVSQVIMTT